MNDEPKPLPIAAPFRSVPGGATTDPPADPPIVSPVGSPADSPSDALPGQDVAAAHHRLRPVAHEGTATTRRPAPVSA
ncbi:hypothetical protein AB0M64_14125 [Streptomyces sp. NPDC051771]|uniref:hypothetical protein n=1 Tax=Streptomyces sp. NPDC051771 TaxID=3154847 RepID=UPI0034441197